MAIVGEGLVVVRAVSTAFDGDLAGAASKMIKVLTVAGATAAAGAIAGIATIGMAYEQSLNVFQAVSNANAEQMARVGKAAKDLGADMSLPATSAADAAKAMTELAKAGLSVDESLAAAKGTLQLAAAAQVSESVAAEISANALNAFGLAGSEAGRVADILAASANASSAEITDMADALKMSSAVAAAAGIPIEDLSAVLGELANKGIKGCYDDQTEVLTRCGFLPWADVTETTEFATVNPATDAIEYQVPTRLVRYRHTGKMYEVHNRGVDLLVTPEHRMWVRPYGQPDFRVLTTEEVQGRHVSYRSGGLHWAGDDAAEIVLPGFSQPRGGRWTKKVPEKRIPADAWAAFMGYYLSEGSHDYRKGSYRVSIAQRNGPKKDRMLADLRRLGFTIHVSQRALVILSEQLYRAVRDQGHCHEKHVPDYVKGWSTRLLETFWMAFCLGDGSEDGAGCWTSSLALRDGLSEVVLKCGWAAFIRETAHVGDRATMLDGRVAVARRTSWRVSANKRRITPSYNPTEYKPGNIHAERAHRGGNFGVEGWVDYDGEVFCATVPNSLLIVRRNGKTVVSGNSDAGTSVKQMLLSLEGPSKKAAGTMKELGINIYDSSGKMLSMRDIIANVGGAMKGLTDEQRNQALATIFGSDAVRSANIVLLGGVDAYDKMKEAVTKSGAAADVAAAKTKGLKGAWEGLKSQLETVAISIYEKASPAVEHFVRGIADGIPKAQKAVGDMFDALVGGFQNPDATIGDSVGKWEAVFLRIGAAAAQYLPTVKDMLGDVVDAIQGGIALAKPILDTLFDVFSPVAATAAVIVVGLVDGLGALGRWVSEHEGPTRVIGEIIATLLVPAIVSIGVTATISAAQAVIAWVAMEVRAIAAAIVHGVQVALIVGGWILMGITAMAQAAVIAVAWLISIAPIALVVLAIAGLAYAFVHNWDTIKDAVLTGVEFVVDKILGMAEWVTKAGAAAFGWVPGVGDKLREAAAKVEAFRDDVNFYLDGLHSKTVDVYVNTYETTYINTVYGEEARSSPYGRQTAYASGGVIAAWSGPRAAAGFRTRGATLVGEGNAPEYVIPTDPKYRKRALDLMGALGGELGLTPSSTPSPALERAVLALTDAVERLTAMDTGGIHVHGVSDPFAAARAALAEQQWKRAS